MGPAQGQDIKVIIPGIVIRRCFRRNGSKPGSWEVTTQPEETQMNYKFSQRAVFLGIGWKVPRFLRHFVEVVSRCLVGVAMLCVQLATLDSYGTPAFITNQHSVQVVKSSEMWHSGAAAEKLLNRASKP
jgi:hypothetical protein